ncbi:MAG: phenylalanine--tRNA ligase beta subunit-related protein [Chloroflexota bacterium]
MLSISASNEWRNAHPGAIIGLLELAGVDNTRSSPELNQRKRAVESLLRERYNGFTRTDFLALPVMAAYERYYRRFDKTYHVQLQVESIVLKGRNLPDVSPLVDANFIAEVETCALTAGHDVARLREPIWIDVSREGDQITQLNGATKPIRAGDMVMRDAGGVACTILYGQDNRSPISPATTQVLYVTYAPAGVPAGTVEAELQTILDYVRLFSPDVQLEQFLLMQA